MDARIERSRAVTNLRPWYCTASLRSLWRPLVPNGGVVSGALVAAAGLLAAPAVAQDPYDPASVSGVLVPAMPQISLPVAADGSVGLPDWVPGMPSPPAQPLVTTRPDRWPGGGAGQCAECSTAHVPTSGVRGAATLLPPATIPTPYVARIPASAEGAAQLVQATEPAGPSEAPATRRRWPWLGGSLWSRGSGAAGGTTGAPDAMAASPPSGSLPVAPSAVPGAAPAGVVPSAVAVPVAAATAAGNAADPDSPPPSLMTPGLPPTVSEAAMPAAQAPAAGPNPAGGAGFLAMPGAAPTLPTTEVRDIDAATIIARVNGDVILAAEVMGRVNEIIAQNADRIAPHEVETIRQQLMQSQLQPVIETRLLFTDAVRKIPAENFPKVQEKMGEEFEKEPLRRMMKHAGVETRAQLDAHLQKFGSSVDRERDQFVTESVARQWLFMQAQINEVVSRQEMLDLYHANAAQYERPARARWQELFLRFDKFESRAACQAAIATLGNQILAGTPFVDVARAHSHGLEAPEGGLHDWTTKGSLVSQEMDRALFELPPGRLSPILEDNRGLHIVMVLEREEAGRVPFSEAQEEIKEAILDQRRKVAREEYMQKLRTDAYVWTIFDSPHDRMARQPGGPLR